MNQANVPTAEKRRFYFEILEKYFVKEDVKEVKFNDEKIRAFWDDIKSRRDKGEGLMFREEHEVARGLLDEFQKMLSDKLAPSSKPKQKDSL